MLKNFKGITILTIDFEDITNIYGENKLGKTTIFDGFTWLIFGKDSKDRTKFDVQPLDERNNVVHMLETEVSAILEIDNKAIVLKKILKENWVKKRGEIDSDIKGIETLYYINELPVKLSEYKAKINSIVDEKLFKLISSPLYFSLNMKWEDRREVILNIVGDIKADSVIKYNPSLEPLIKLLKDTDLETLKRTISAKIKKLNENKKSIPYRVDELNNSINDGVDFDVLTFTKENILEDIKNLEEKLTDESKLSGDVMKEREKLYELKSRKRDIEEKAQEEKQLPLKQLNGELRETENNLYRLENQVDRANSTIANSKVKVSQLEKELQELKAKWHLVDEKLLVISEEEFMCPTCKRQFEVEDIQGKKEELEGNFETDKIRKIQTINLEGQAKRALQEKLQAGVLSYETELSSLMGKLVELKTIKLQKEEEIKNFQGIVDLSGNEEYEGLKAKIKELEDKPQWSIVINKDVTELKAKRKECQLKLEEINKGLSLKEQNVKTKARITELSEEEKRLAESISELEGEEFLCEKYIKTKVEMLEEGINKKFKFVKLKLFNTLGNGAVEECCEALIEGVPFSNANTAAQFNAGIDIINALCEYYKISAPVFIDNRESVNEIISCNSQLISLVVSRDKQLVVEVETNPKVIEVLPTDAKVQTEKVEKAKPGPDF